MDDAQVARSRATVHSGIYEMEFGACFSTDSHGFFKRSLIESCTASPENPISLPSGEVDFHAQIRGNPNIRYVYGIDPASEVDNFTGRGRPLEDATLILNKKANEHIYQNYALMRLN